MCDGACYCHGDIDDCDVEDPQYAFEHCAGCGCSDDEEGWDYFDDLDLNDAGKESHGTR